MTGARYVLRGEVGFGMDVEVTLDAQGAWSMRGAVRQVSEGQLSV